MKKFKYKIGDKICLEHNELLTGYSFEVIDIVKKSEGVYKYILKGYIYNEVVPQAFMLNTNLVDKDFELTLAGILNNL